MTKLQQRATEALKSLFVNPGRVSLVEGAPGWVLNLVKLAHGDLLPDDARYALIGESLAYFAEVPFTSGSDEEDERLHEFADAVDVYAHDLLTWAALPGRLGFADLELASHSFWGTTVVELLMSGQYNERHWVIGSVLESLTEEEQ